MVHLDLVAAIVLLVSVTVISACVMTRVLVPNRAEVLRLQTERIERMLHDDSDRPLEAIEEG